MTEFITSDPHFGHANILRFNPETRQYANVDEMNERMIQEWNAVVQPQDHTYILGDFAFLSAARATEIARRLNGRKTLIKGNHDGKLVADAAFRAEFEAIYDYREITHDGFKVCLFHYPIAEWNACHRGSIHFHGHLHGKPSGIEQARAADAGMDATGKIVVRLSDLVNRVKNNGIRGHGDNKEEVRYE
jgi:calcineurin-like phosphoesterase family protein